MDLPTVLVLALERLSESIGQDPELIVHAARDLGGQLEVSVSHFRGTRIQLIEQGQPVVFTATHPQDPVTDIETSLELPIDLGRGRPTATIWMYAAAPGAFIDLAADLASALDLRLPCVRLDTDLPGTLRSGATGLVELRLINYALGVLINDGCPAELALDTLTRHATECCQSTLDHAIQMLARVRGKRPLGMLDA